MIYTIGYEGARLTDFIASLKVAGVDTLIDVRELAISRRKGFAKTALSNALTDSNIEYIHLKGLGDPKPGREAARSGNFNLFKKIFSSHMETEFAQQHLDAAMNIVSETDACLMCYERDPLNCHRSIVAGTISEVLGKEVKHLGVQQGVSSNWLQLNKSKTLVLVKARPHASEKYVETVCCAGLDADGKWARLFPVPFRRLQKSQKFARWDWIEYDWYKPKGDTRTESRHIQEDSIEVAGKVSLKKDKDRILQGAVQPSLEAAMNNDMTLALLVPKTPQFKVSAKPETQLTLERRAYETAANQGSLFGDDIDAIKPCPFEFRYDWIDDEGHSHSHDCGDWETGTTFFRWRRKYGEVEALNRISEEFGSRYPSKGMAFALGTHSRRPKQWLLVGVLRLNPTEQMSLL